MSLWNLRNTKTEDLRPLYYEDYHKSDDDQKDDNPDHNAPLDPALEAIKVKWEKEQLQLKKRISLDDDQIVRKMLSKSSKSTFYIGGMDISFIKGDNVNACAALVVCSFPDLEVVYEDFQMVKLTQPYIAGFLAFREVEFMVQLYDTVKKTKPQYTPQVIMVDGNGIMHHRGVGSASHLGILLGVPCLGVAKNLLQVDGIVKNEEHAEQIARLKKSGDDFSLVGASGRCYGKALKSCEGATKPVYVSPGHKISVESAALLVHKCSKFRVPEPIRKADLNSREYLRVYFKED